MKQVKKLLTFLLVIGMMMSFCTTTYAVNGTGGKITVNNATAGDTYDAYRIFDLTYTGEGESAKVSYTLDDSWVDFFIGDSAKGKDYLVTTKPADGNTYNQLNYKNTVYFINITEENVAAFAQAALDWCAKDGNISSTSSQPASSTSVVFENLPYGYYLVYPRGASDIADGNASICSLTSTVPEQTIQAKATKPGLDKNVTVDGQDSKSATVEIGQEVEFKITGKVPDTTGFSKYNQWITDKMTDGLTFGTSVTATKMKVTFDTTDISISDGNGTTNATVSFSDNGFKLYFDMTQYKQYAGKPFTITYVATVNENAVVKLTENAAKLEYSNNPADPSETDTTQPERPTVLYSSQIVINKYDGANEATKLEDAWFVLKDGTGEDAKYYKQTVTDSTVTKVEWVSDQDQATVFKTDKSGSATIKGLKDGTYYLVETKAPDGYNLLDQPVSVTLTHTTDGNNKEIGVSVTSDIANQTGTVLPETGGMGTRMFLMCGSVAIMLAGIFLVTNKRVKKELF